MPNSSSTFNIPSFARQEAYDFEAVDESFDIYQELSRIADEIESCRRRHS